MEKIKNERKFKNILKTDIKMKGLTIYIILNILYIFGFGFLKVSQKFTYEAMAKGFLPLLIVNIVFILIIIFKKFYKKDIIYIFVGLIIIFGIISTIFAINSKTAIFGKDGRYEGLISISYYFSLMILSGFIKKMYKKIIVFTIILTGLVQLIYAICQIYDVDGVYKMIHASSKVSFLPEGPKFETEIWATGFTTNPNFFAIYMLLCQALSLGIFIEEKKIVKKLLYMILSVSFVFGILISNTMSCIVGLVVVLIFSLLYSIKNKQFKDILILVLAGMLVVCIGIKTGKTRIVKDVSKFTNQAVDIASGEVKDSYGTSRIYIWKKTFEILPKNLLHGVGIDNFIYAFDGGALVNNEKRIRYDKAHNEYLQILVTEGIFCLISYLVMYGIICIRGFKKSLKKEEVYLFLPVIGYLVQAFFNISVIEVAPIFFIILGLCMSKAEEKNN